MKKSMVKKVVDLSLRDTLNKALLHSRFINTAQLYPDKIALVNGVVTLTYKELFEKAAALSNHLNNIALPSDKLIGILLKKGWHQIVSVLGIVMSGRAYVPIDTNSSISRISDIIKLSDLHLLITEEEYAKQLNDVDNLKIINFNETKLDNISFDLCLQDTNDLAYLIFTSGSTGVPKGVAIQHFAVTNTIEDMVARFDISANDSVLGLSDLNFDLSVFDIFGTFSVGGKLVVPTSDENRDPKAWVNLVIKEKISIWNTVPALLSMFYEFNKHYTFPDSIRLFLLSGDLIPVSLVQNLKKVFPNSRHISLGGATEASIWSILYEMEEIKHLSKIPYGKAMLNQTVEILDDKFNRCEEGQKGEIYIGGIGLAKEYWQDTKRTAESFVFNKAGKRLYKTGDYGKYLKDGNIEFLGRKDYQVKINGYRIELEEIESLLCKLHGVNQAIAVVKESNIYAFLTPNEVDIDSCLDYLKSKLPFYMIPKEIYCLPTFPLTINGKVDRQALNEIISSQSLDKRIIEKPRNNIESTLLKYWSKILNYSSVSIHDNFFKMGGKSLSAVKLISEINKNYHKDYPLSIIFNAPTISQLAEAINTDSYNKKVILLNAPGKPKLFLIHPVSGEIFCYYNLSQALSTHYSVHAIPLDLSINDGLSALAVEYSRLITQSSTSSSSYLIAGWSIGGLIAFEIAKLLGKDKISFLGLIDTYPPLSMLLQGKILINQTSLIKTIYKYYIREVTKIVSTNVGAAEIESLTKLNPVQGIEMLKNIVVSKNSVNHPEYIKLINNFTYQFKKILEFSISYKPKEAFDGTVNLFTSEDMTPEISQLWDNLSKRTKYQKLEGDHLSILEEPKVEDLAKKITDSVKEGNHDSYL